MSLDSSLIATLGDELFDALNASRAVTPLTERHPEITIEDAYAIQQRMIARRLERGEKVVGKKIGVTSKAVMAMLGVGQPDFGYMMDGMIVNEGDVISMSALIQPKAEGEIAFVLKKDLIGPGISAADVMAATEGVMPCFEIVDSRIRDWKIKIQDTVADNASSGMFVLGPQPALLRQIDLRTIGMTLRKNGHVASTGAGAACMGDPVNAVAWLANRLGEFGQQLSAGQVILSGALGPVQPVVSGDWITVHVGRLSEVAVTF